MANHFFINPRILKALSLFASDDEERYNLAGVFFGWDEDGVLSIVATDGHCLGSWKHLPGEDDLVRELGTAIIPMRSFMPLINEASKKNILADKSQIEVAIEREIITMTAIFKGGATMSMRAKAVDAEFPNWRGIIPPENKFKAIKKLGVNPALVKRFRDAGRLIAPNPDGEAIVGLRFTGESEVIEVKIGGAEEQFVGYLMPAMLMGKWVPKPEGEAVA